LAVSFQSRVLGARMIEVRLEKTHAELPPQFTVASLRLASAVKETAQIGDGLVGGSATIRYVVINQGVQEFRVSLPARWKNVDFTGPNLRRKELLPLAVANADTNVVTWSIVLQDKAWGGYTLVVTYDEAFDPHQATLQLGGLHALGVERETGTVAVTSAAGLQLRATRSDGPLPRGEDRDRAFAVEIVYAQKVDSLVSLRPRDIALSAPKTDDLQTTYAEWELFVPGTHHLRHFGGNMMIAEGTAYGLRDALRELADVYRDAWGRGARVVVGLLVLGLAVLPIVNAVRHRRLLEALVVVGILAVLAGMLLPALAKAKARSTGMAAMNSLKQIGLAVRIYANDHDGRLPASFEQMNDELSTDRVTRDPESNEPFVYLGAGKTETALHPTSVLAFAPAHRGHRAVLLGDGSVQQMTEARFVEAMRLSGQLTQPTSAPAQGVASGTVPGIQARPELPGLRPLRIDLPRCGARFVFTKVLNVGQSPLAVEAWVVTTKTWNRMRSALQVTVFLGGLFLLGRQLRRPMPRSLTVALALGLVLGSIGSLLLAERALGLALVIAVPLIALGAVILIGRRLWQRHAARRRAEVADSAMPTESAGASPVTPLVALLLLLPIGQAVAAEERSVAQSVASTVKPTIESVTLLSAEYSGTVRERVAQVEAVISLSAGKPGQVVPLFGEDVAVEEFSATPRTVRLLREGKCVAVRLPKAGPATVRVKFLVKLEGDVTRWRLAFGVPAALSSRVTLTVQEPEAVVEFPTAVSHHSSTAQEQTHIEAVLGAADRVELAWMPRVKRAAEIAATVFCESATLATFSGGVLNLRSQFEYQVTQGELREVRVRLPAGHRLLRVEGEHLRTWQIKSGTNSEPAAAEPEQILTVELIKGVSPSYRLTVETERALDPPPSSVPVQLPHALDVKRETGWIALSGSDDLALTADTPPGLQKVDLAEFTNAFATPQTLTVAYQFLRPDFGLPVRVETLQPQVEAIVRNRLRLGADQLYLTTHMDYTIKRAGLFTLRLWAPADFRIESVTGTNLAQWVEKTESGRRIVEVTLKQRISGAYALQLQLVQPLPALRASLDVPGVHPLDTTKLTGFVVVSPEPGVQIKPGAREGLTEVPVASVPEGGAGLAYRYLSNDPAPATAPWRLGVSPEAVDSWVRAEVMTWLTLSETLASGRALVRFEVQNAPVKEFRLRIPAAFRNVEIEGANVRRRDQAGEEWRVELQSKVVGTHTLTVTWEQPWSVREEAKESRFDVTGVKALGVERETGAVAVIARAPLQVTPHAASAELIRLDVRELPEWGGRADPDTVLAYRYLRPGYQLALAAQRFAPAAVLQALVQEARLTTVVADDGQMVTELALRLRNNGRQFLEIALPAGAQLWSAFVAGQAVRPGVRNGKLLLPLEGDAGGLISLELTYVGTGVFPQARGQVQLASPALDVPIQNARWDLYLPADYGYRGFGGTMTHEASAAPVYRSFTLTEYQQVEQDNWKNRDQEASSSIDDALSKIKSGRLDEANKAYLVARRYGLKGGKGEAVQLEQELRRTQSGNLLNAQQTLVANNAAFVNQSAGQPAPVQQARANYDSAAAEQQWVKLQQAQEVATATAKPLKVNLPTRGLRHSFSQVLQTEVGKPMLVQFVAVSANAALWPMRLVGAVLAFAALWGVSVGLLRTQGSACRMA
jgi:competence protein ComGC